MIHYHNAAQGAGLACGEPYVLYATQDKDDVTCPGCLRVLAAPREHVKIPLMPQGVEHRTGTGTATPGQIAYDAFMLEMMNTRPAGSDRWHLLESRLRDAWEVAAQAVRGAPLGPGLLSLEQWRARDRREDEA